MNIIRVNIRRVANFTLRGKLKLNLTDRDLASWIAKVFEIDFESACELISKSQEDKYIPGRCLVFHVHLTDRQLSRYVTYRDIDNLKKVWQYPNIIGVYTKENETQSKSKKPAKSKK